MKCIIAGSRTIENYKLVLEAFTSCDWHNKITEIVSGKANGVDTLGERVAVEFGLPVKDFPADWNKYKRAAGPIRNGQMAKYADTAIIVIEGESRGSRNMVSQMQKLKKPYALFEIREGILHRIGV